MNKTTILRFTLFKTPISVALSALIGAVGLWVILAGVALALTNLTPLDAIIAGLIGTLLHFVGETLHQFGHIMAAKRVGYPARGIRLWFVLGSTLYPHDEPDLPANIHIRRALGGPLFSMVTTLFCLGWALLWWDYGDLPRFIVGFVLLDNALVFTLGALFPPMYFGDAFANDGGTIMHWLRQK